MFETNLLPISFVISVIEFIFLLIQLVLYFSRKTKSSLRLIILTSFFILHNIVSGLMPDNNISIPILFQNILSNGSGIMLASYFFYYLTAELHIYQVKIFNTKLLFTSLIFVFILGFGGTYFFTNNLDLSKKIFVAFASGIALYFCIKTTYFLIQKIKSHTKDTLPTKSMLITGNLSIVFIATMPFVAFFKDTQALNHTLVNISLFLITYAFLKHFFHQSQKENKILKEYQKNKTSKHSEENILKNYNLSVTEVKVAILMLQDLTYIEIGEKLNSAPKTISKQASDIYKKVNCKNKKAFLNIIRKQKTRTFNFSV